MRIVSILLFAYLFAMSAAHAEKKIYKCTDGDGSSVFSPYPCGAAAQEMKVETSAPSTSSMTPSPSSMPLITTTPAALTQVSDVDGIKCQQDAQRLKAYPAHANLDMLLQRQAELMRTYTSDTSEGVKVLIGNMDAAIATEQTRIDEGRKHADRAYADALDKCQARKAARENQTGKP